MNPPVALSRSVSEDSLVSLMRVYRPRPWISTAHTHSAQDVNLEGGRGDFAALSLVDQNAEAAITGDAGPRSNGQRPTATFRDLAIEILDRILDFLFDDLRAVFPNSRTTGTETLSTWQRKLRHPRRRELTDLALVNRAWTERVQRRIYRHIQVQATGQPMIDILDWFNDHPELCSYVRSIEIIFPVWNERVLIGALAGQTQDDIHFGPRAHHFYLMPQAALASLESLFELIQLCFPNVNILTLDGGTCRNGQLIRHFNGDEPWPTNLRLSRRLPTLAAVKTIITRGSYNLARTEEQYFTIARAFPNLLTCDCTFWPFDLAVYELMVSTLRISPAMRPKLRNLSLSFDSLCGLGELDGVRHWSLCEELGTVAAHMETFTLTGRICGRFFSHLGTAYHRGEVKDKRLRALNLDVETLCSDCELARDYADMSAATVSGIENPQFIDEFEIVVTGAIMALGYVPSLEHIRIRTLNVDSRWLLFAPYFYFDGAECRGFWSPLILQQLRVASQGVRYVAQEDGIYPVKAPSEGEVVEVARPTVRPNSLSKKAYKLIERKVSS